MNAHPDTGPTTSLSLRTTRLWWVSPATEMRQTKECGESPGHVVQRQQSVSERGEDCGELQRSMHQSCPFDHQLCCCGTHEQHHVPGCARHRGPLLYQEGSTASLFAPQTETSWSPSLHHMHLLQRHHRERPEQLYHGVAPWPSTGTCSTEWEQLPLSPPWTTFPPPVSQPTCFTNVTCILCLQSHTNRSTSFFVASDFNVSRKSSC